MSFHPEHELHKRRFGRNLGLLAVLCGFVALVFVLTIVKVSEGGKMEAFDHSVRPSLTTPEAGQ
ncbi:hypothetical protein [Actibacterium sp. XHP0104]|uniref:hypothetical protein n=1 Tax=Actibacterium sp. XHP0104 TaxID=2984335 RepID=UPI0021E8A605|nr:hypothetical protein [Actibacterium sp. XHP0104]MCV2880530.1 hypothetical protein [Actibacterium sp. XHP0104]